ncbi:hypothetical protein SUBVAR_06556 [Subdoligranulum variabile DSM 15176]|uniref:Uncharacterized protein n=1 Tax=Subdoligranulum variabile DSM 15176 TaxID=411471 RepID=D1PQ88_9FIRM|nr:hypothetical protein SUBVAR_06556 [Subdoligranulum variabile DSM 15176]
MKRVIPCCKKADDAKNRAIGFFIFLKQNRSNGETNLLYTKGTSTEDGDADKEVIP